MVKTLRYKNMYEIINCLRYFLHGITITLIMTYSKSIVFSL